MPVALERRLARLEGAPAHEVLALRYATWMTTRAHCFMEYERYGEADAPMRMDFFLWVLRRGERVIVVDTGFEPGAGARRARECLIEPVRALRSLGVEPAEVSDVVLTHLHYDHIGNVGAFPRATLHLHARELDFWQSPAAQQEMHAALVDRRELEAIRSAERAGRVRRIDDDAEVTPGVLALWSGGHTPGQLLVAVAARDSLVVLASDALHFYEELDRDRPFAVTADVKQAKAAYALLRGLRALGATLVAGHDPAVLDAHHPLGGRLGALAVSIA